MSRGPGRVQISIERMMDERVDDMLLISDFVQVCYPGVNRAEKKHRVSVARAAARACTRKHWKYYRWQTPGGMNVYYNPFDVRSYVLAKLRADHINQSVTDQELRAIVDGREKPRHYHASTVEGMKQGGAFWLHVEINKADRDGRTADAATYRDALNQRVAALMRGGWK